MEINIFIVEILKTIAWPLVSLIIVLLLRKPVIELVSFLKKVKYQDLEFEFDRELDQIKEMNPSLTEISVDKFGDEIREKLMKLLSISPESTILESWRLLENKMIEFARLNKFDFPPAVWTMPLVLGGMLLNNKMLSNAQYNTLRSLKYLRDQVTHSKNETVTVSNALEYINLTVWMISYFNK